jgi:hypothetical protein
MVEHLGTAPSVSWFQARRVNFLPRARKWRPGRELHPRSALRQRAALAAKLPGRGG